MVRRRERASNYSIRSGARAFVLPGGIEPSDLAFISQYVAIIAASLLVAARRRLGVPFSRLLQRRVARIPIDRIDVLYNNAAVQTACSNALNYWYSRDPQSVRIEQKAMTVPTVEQVEEFVYERYANQLGADFDVRTVKPGVRMPYSLFPKLSGQLDHLVVARSVEAWESAHSKIDEE